MFIKITITKIKTDNHTNYNFKNYKNKKLNAYTLITKTKYKI